MNAARPNARTLRRSAALAAFALVVVTGCASSTAAVVGRACTAPVCEAGTVGDASACQACGAFTCTAATCDDGAAASACLERGSLECRIELSQSSSFTWEEAMRHCERLGEGFRLPTKAELARIGADRSLCRNATPRVWASWTATCAGFGPVDDGTGGELPSKDRAWLLSGAGVEVRAFTINLDFKAPALCVR